MNRFSPDSFVITHVTAETDCGVYCFVVYVRLQGESYIFSIEARDQEELNTNIFAMFESLKLQYQSGELAKEIAAAVSQIILNEHSHA